MDLLTPQEAAEMLKIQPKTIYVWLRTGKLPGFKLGSGRTSEWRIKRKSLMDFLHKHANKAEQELTAERWQRFMKVVENAPVCDESLTEEDERRLEIAEQEIKDGDYMTLSEFKKRWGR